MPKICSGEPNARAEGCGGQVKGKGPCRKWQRTAVIGGAVSEVSGGKGPRSAAQYSSPWKRLLFDSLDFIRAPGLDTGAVLVVTVFPERLRLLPALDIPGNTSKTKGTPRKYQDEPSSWSRRRVPGGWGFLEVLSGSGWGLWPPGSRWGYGLYPRVPVQQCSGLAIRRPEMGETGSDSGLAGAPDLYLDFPHGRRVSYRIGSVLAVSLHP